MFLSMDSCNASLLMFRKMDEIVSELNVWNKVNQKKERNDKIPVSEHVLISIVILVFFLELDLMASS